MKVLRLFGPGDLRIDEEPQPEPAVGEVLVRVKAVGICGSDLHWYNQAGIGDARLDHPLVLGHEFAGVIASGDRAGQAVAVDPCIPCRSCEYCLEGSPNLCLNQRFAGHSQQDGALVEMLAWPEHLLHILPPSLSAAEGAALEPLGVALYAVDQAGLRPGCTVGVMGCGPVGLLIVRLARLVGAIAVLATERLPHRLEAAAAFGATAVFPVGERGDEASAGVLAASGGRGLDVVFEAAGEAAAVETAMAVVRPGGRVILVGIPDDDRTSFSASMVRRKGLTIIVSRRMKHTYPRAIALVEQGLVDLKPLLTRTFPLERSVEAFEAAARRDGLKITIVSN